MFRKLCLLALLLLFASPAFADDATAYGPITTTGSGDMDMQGHSILNAGNVNAGKVKLTSTYTAGASCEAKTIGLDASGKLLACKSGKWISAEGGGQYGGTFTLHQHTMSRKSYPDYRGTPRSPAAGYSCYVYVAKWVSGRGIQRYWTKPNPNVQTGHCNCPSGMQMRRTGDTGGQCADGDPDHTRYCVKSITYTCVPG